MKVNLRLLFLIFTLSLSLGCGIETPDQKAAKRRYQNKDLCINSLFMELDGEPAGTTGYFICCSTIPDGC
jgi:hypothetical protein